MYIVLGIEAAARSANGNVEKLLSVSTYFDVYQPPTAGTRLSDNPLAHYLALPPPISPGQAWSTRVCCVINTDTERHETSHRSRVDSGSGDLNIIARPRLVSGHVI